MQIPSRKSLFAPSFVPSTNAVGAKIGTRPYEAPHDVSKHRANAWHADSPSRIASALAALAMATVTMLALVLLPANVETGTATPAARTTGGHHAEKG